MLEMVEPLEETRSELIFATEPTLSSLELSIPGYGRHASIVELDEVEVGIIPCLDAWSSCQHLSPLDPERHPPTLQRPIISTLLSSIDPQ